MISDAAARHPYQELVSSAQTGLSALQWRTLGFHFGALGFRPWRQYKCFAQVRPITGTLGSVKGTGKESVDNPYACLPAEGATCAGLFLSAISRSH